MKPFPTYSVITNTGREVRCKWDGKRFELTVFGVSFSDTYIEWHQSLNYTAIRFQWLVEHNSKKPRQTRHVGDCGVFEMGQQ